MALLKEYLKDLSECFGATGDEEEVARYLEKVFKKNGWSASEDVLGNVIARKGDGKKRVLVAAHMDEVSLAVSAITKEGLLKFVKVGGIFDGILPTARVTMHAKQKIHGVIGSKPPHLMKEEETKKVIESDEMYIDVGAKDEKEVERMGVRVGTPITFESKYELLAGDRVMGKAFDDRAGCAVLCKLAEELKVPKDLTVFLVGTVREETGLWGAGTSAFAVEPDFAVAVDVCFAAGTPDVTMDKVPVEMGGGPAVTLIEGGGRGLIMSRKLTEWVESVGRKAGVKLQFEISARGSTDASRIQYTRAGFLAASVGIPTRYLHSENEVLSLKDLEGAKNLVSALVREFPHYK